MKILVLSSTKERNGIADYTRQLFRKEFLEANHASAEVLDISFGAILSAPFRKASIIHVQHEFFMFDRFVSLSALPAFLYLWMFSGVCRYRLVTTLHSVYNIKALDAALPNFQKLRFLFPLLSLYLRLHVLIACKCSDRTIVLTEASRENLGLIVSRRNMQRKVRRTVLGNYAACIRLQDHNLLEARFGIRSTDRVFTLFGFAFPAKGYEHAIRATDILVNRYGRVETKLVVVSGETLKKAAPGGGQGGAYLDSLRQLAKDCNLTENVVFTGYLADNDPLLEEVFAKTLCFVFPYSNRPFASAAVATTMATGKPLLVTRTRCFDDFERLPSVPEADPTALAEKMKEFMDTPGQVEEASMITRLNAAKYSMDQVFAKHLEIYQEVIPAAR